MERCDECGLEHPASQACRDAWAEASHSATLHIATTTPDAPPRSEAPLPTQELIGGRYQVVRKIGSGGFGRVYEAIDTKLEKRVALKLQSREATASAEQVHLEAVTASQVGHPAVIDVFDYGHDANAGAYVVMEYLEGQDLAQLIRETGRLRPIWALDIAIRCADALSVIHERGIVHRDLKPANIFLDERQPGDTGLKILDFGAATARNVQQLFAGAPDGPGGLGTPLYMAPEQALATSSPDQRADVYSLGVIVFEMLVGEPPFIAESPIEVIRMHLQEPPPRASARCAQLAPSPLDDVLLRALAKEPRDRIQTMRELSLELQDCLARLSIDKPEVELLSAASSARLQRVEVFQPRILCADDSQNVRSTLRRTLEGGGYRVRLAESGVEAIRVALQERIDLFLIDMNMPLISGLVLVRQLREIPRYANTPIVLMSTNPSEKNRHKADNAGASDWIAKPLQAEEVLRVLATLLHATGVAS